MSILPWNAPKSQIFIYLCWIYLPLLGIFEKYFKIEVAASPLLRFAAMFDFYLSPCGTHHTEKNALAYHSHTYTVYGMLDWGNKLVTWIEVHVNTREHDDLSDN